MYAREGSWTPVPDVAACEFDQGTYAGSTKVDDAVRDVEPWLNRRKQIRNFDDLFGVLVVDVWLANKDRNIGNVLGRPLHGGKIEFVFMDFEKSVALHPSPIVSSTMLKPRELWPSGALGRELRAQRPLFPPVDMIEKIQSLATERCAEIIHESVVAMDIPVSWEDDSVNALSKRAGKIQELAEEDGQRNDGHL
jgi:hypothetical protein